MTRPILLIYPPSRSQSHETCPTGLLLLAAVLDKAGRRITLLDANAVAARRSIDQVAERVAQLKPDIVGITLVTPIVVDPANYGGTNNREFYSTLFSSRGCPAKCSYCAGSRLKQGVARMTG